LNLCTKTLLLVDGSSYLYRAYHALPELRTASGEPTGAIYGVLNMLKRLHADYRPDYSACVFDAKGKTFRDAWYPDYKANRPPMADDLARQIEPLHDAIRALGWPLLMLDGVEADDVIGTLAEKAFARGVRTVVSTGDKDMVQLVNSHVTLVNTMSNETLDEAAVWEKFAVRPAQFVDYLTLIGDSIDNVPGVAKVGPKTAAKWIQQYQTLENVVAHAEEIGGVVGENLRKVRDWLPQAKKLLTVRADLDLPVELETLSQGKPDNSRLLQLFDRFEFKRWRQEVQDALRSHPHTASALTPPSREETEVSLPARQYETVVTETDFERWLAHIAAADLICIETKTTATDPFQARLVGIALSVAERHAAYVPLAHRHPGAPEQLALESVLARLKPFFEDPERRKVGHDLKYDRHILANHGVRLAGVMHDTLLQSYVLESHKPHDIDSLAQRHLKETIIKLEQVAGKGAGQIAFEQVALDRATAYAAEQVDVTLRVHHLLYPLIEADPKYRHVYHAIEMPLLEVLYTVERNGVLIDGKMLAGQSSELGQKMLELEAKVIAAAGQPFNLNSPKQIQEILFDQHRLPVLKKTPGGAPSTDEEVLQQLALDYPLPKLILEYRGLAKLKSTYTDKLPRMLNESTGRVHTNYAQAVAVTGRLASTEPNLQNIPTRSLEGRRIREAFIAPPGAVIVSADYSQIELRIMAHLSADAGLLRAFAAGLDIHRATAAEVFSLAPEAVSSEQRRYAKVINFGLIYGMSAFGLAAQLGVERAAAQSYMERYFARYPGVAQYMKRTREQARAEGFVETVFGRRLWLPEITSGSPGRRQAAERAAINAPMQGTAADLIKLAMIAVQGWIEAHNLRTMLVMQVHDELVLEAPEDELQLLRERLPDLMCNVARLAVPLVVDVGVGPNWEQAH
jgi:DNA polymerase I